MSEALQEGLTHIPGSFRQIPHFEAPVPLFLEADNIPGSAAINWVGTQLNSAAANETDARVVRMESNAIVRA